MSTKLSEKEAISLVKNNFASAYFYEITYVIQKKYHPLPKRIYSKLERLQMYTCIRIRELKKAF